MQWWAEAYSALKQLPDIHTKAQKVATEANKNQRLLTSLAAGEGNP